MASLTSMVDANIFVKVFVK